jgi:hypothetical protein
VLLDNPLPRVGSLPQGAGAGLSSLLLAVVEEIERQELNQFSLRASGSESEVQVQLSTGDGVLSDAFITSFKKTLSGDGHYQVSCEGMNITHAVLTLIEAGITPEIPDQGQKILLKIGL